MRFRGLVVAIIAIILVALSVTPAQAATLNTKVSVEVPTYAGKNVASQIFVHVCSGASCNFVSRTIVLYVDGKKVKQWSSALNTVSYSWKSSSVKKHSVQAKVLARSGYKAAATSMKSVTVKTGLLDTQKYGWSSYLQCESGVCPEFPAEAYPSNVMPSIFVWLGTDIRQSGRLAYLQWQKSDGTWVSDDSGTAVWDEGAAEYGVELSFDFDRSTFCPDSDGNEFEYRVLLPSTSKTTQTSGYYRSIHLNCGETYPVTGSVVADFDYRNQYTDSPADFWFFVDDYHNVGFTIKTQWCEPDVYDCSDMANWTDFDSQTYVINPNDWVSLGVPAENDYPTDFIRAVIIPGDGSAALYSPVYTVTSGED